MTISSDDIKHIAELSRIQLTPEEEKKFGSQLESILEYVSQLNKVDTKRVEVTAQVSGLVDISRPDVVEDWDKSEISGALNQASVEDGYIKVKRVL